MNKNHKIELNKFEVMVLMFSRTIQTIIKTFVKSKFAKILVLVFILSFVSAGILSAVKSFSYISKGNILYKNVEYKLSLENYELANQWWLFEHINSRLQNNSLLIKIRKAQIMIKSTNYYEQGKKDFEEGRYANAKLNFGYMAKNDPRNSEVEDILLEINKIETIIPISSPNEPIIPNEPVIPVSAPKPKLVPMVYLDFNKEYVSKNDMTITVTSIKKVEEIGTYKYTISYKQENKTVDKELKEGTFKIFFDDNTGLDQYGFFNNLFPGESRLGTYTFKFLKEQKPFAIEFNDGLDGSFSRNQPAANTLKWKVD